MAFPYTSGTFDDDVDDNLCDSLDALWVKAKTNFDLLEYKTIHLPITPSVTGTATISLPVAGTIMAGINFPYDANYDKKHLSAIQIPVDIDNTVEPIFTFGTIQDAVVSGLVKFTVNAFYHKYNGTGAALGYINNSTSFTPDATNNLLVKHAITLTGLAATLTTIDGVLRLHLGRWSSIDGDTHNGTVKVTNMEFRYKRAFAS